jgi:hypothetical protein
VQRHRPPSNVLRAYGQVVRNLGWDNFATKMIFSHTHRSADV